MQTCTFDPTCTRPAVAVAIWPVRPGEDPYDPNLVVFHCRYHRAPRNVAGVRVHKYTPPVLVEHDPTGRACALAGRKAAGHDVPMSDVCPMCYDDAVHGR